MMIVLQRKLCDKVNLDCRPKVNTEQISPDNEHNAHVWAATL